MPKVVLLKAPATHDFSVIEVDYRRCENIIRIVFIG